MSENLPENADGKLSTPVSSQESPAHVDDALVELIDVLEAINHDKSPAKLNKISYIGRDGCRVYY